MEAEHHFCDRLSIMFGPEIKSNFVKKKYGQRSLTKIWLV